MELLTSEMEAFRDDVNRLEAINENIKDVKISIDLKEIKTVLKEHSKQLESQREHQERFYKRMESIFQTAGAYHKWAVVIFIVVILLSVASLVYAYQTKVVSEKVMETTSIENMNKTIRMEKMPKDEISTIYLEVQSLSHFQIVSNT